MAVALRKRNRRNTPNRIVKAARKENLFLLIFSLSANMEINSWIAPTGQIQPQNNLGPSRVRKKMTARVTINGIPKP